MRLNATIGSNVTSGTPTLTIGSVNGPDTNNRLAHFAGNVAYSIGNMTTTLATAGTGTFIFDGTSTANEVTGAITNNALVAFDQAASGTYAGAMSGTGGMTKQGAGTLTLSGANT